MSKCLKRLLNLCICVLLISASGFLRAAPTDSLETDDNYMVVVIAKKGEIKEDESGSYSLKLNSIDTNQIMAITDRPLRVTKLIPMEELKKIIFKWSSNLKLDPRSAVVTIDNKSQTVQLESIQYKDNQIVFTIKGDGEPIRKMKGGNVNVIIEQVDERLNIPAPVAW